jgi:flagellar hook assembly protein FlgD
VLDSGGRLVRRLEAAAAAGPQRVQWDGKNDAGREVAPGVYRACLRSGDSKLSVRLLRVP